MDQNQTHTYGVSVQDAGKTRYLWEISEDEVFALRGAAILRDDFHINWVEPIGAFAEAQQ